MKQSILTTFTFFLVCLLPWQTMAGPIGSSGGNVCIIDTQPVLLDFAELNSKILDVGSPGEQIDFEARYQRVGFKPAPVYRGKIKQKVDEILDRHNDHHLVRVLKTAIDALVIFGVPKLFAKPLGADFSHTVKCSQNNTHAVMGYINSMVFISIPAWNGLSLMTQVGLLIHEGVRTLQNIYPLKLDDKALQDFTAALFSDDLRKFSSLLEIVYELMCPSLKVLNNQFRQYVNILERTRQLPPFWILALRDHLGQSSEVQEAFLMSMAATFHSPLSLAEFEEISRLHYAIRSYHSLLNVRLNTVSLFLPWMAGVRREFYEGLEDPLRQKKINELRALIGRFE